MQYGAGQQFARLRAATCPSFKPSAYAFHSGSAGASSFVLSCLYLSHPYPDLLRRIGHPNSGFIFPRDRGNTFPHLDARSKHGRRHHLAPPFAVASCLATVVFIIDILILSINPGTDSDSECNISPGKEARIGVVGAGIGFGVLA